MGENQLCSSTAVLKPHGSCANEATQAKGIEGPHLQMGWLSAGAGSAGVGGRGARGTWWGLQRGPLLL